MDQPVAAVIAVNFAKTVLQQFRAERHPHAFQGKVYKDAEKLPVAVRDGVGVDLPQPCSKVLFFGVRKRGPQLSGAVRMPQAMAAIST